MNFAGWASCNVTTLFRVCFRDVDVSGSSVGTVIRLSRSSFDVWQVWDQHRFKQICRNVAWVSEIVHQLQAHFYEIPKYCFNTPNGTETMTVSMLPTEKILFFYPPRIGNTSTLTSSKRTQNRNTANAQRFFLLVDQVPLCACAVARVLWESCPVTCSPSCGRLHRQTVKPLPPPTCVVSSFTYLFGWTDHGAVTA